MKNIEVEIRSFITKENYEELIRHFKKHGEFLGEDYQETYYFDCPQDLRIQKNNSFSKIWLKKGKLHDDSREEIEIKFRKEEFETLESLFLALGYNVEIKWFRTRHRFKWSDIKVTIDFTKGYGYIIELEKMSDKKNADSTLRLLKQKLKELNIDLTPREEFEKKFRYYKENWKELV